MIWLAAATLLAAPKTVWLPVQRRLVLPLAAHPATDVAGVWDFHWIAANRIGFLRSYSDPAVVVVDAKGKKISETRIPVRTSRDAWDFKFAWCGGNRFVVALNVGNDTQSWSVDTGRKRVTPLPHRPDTYTLGLAGLADGTFVALASPTTASSNDLTRYAASGRPLWRQSLEAPPNSLRKEIRTSSLTIAPDGAIQLLEFNGTRHMFTPGGKYAGRLQAKDELDSPSESNYDRKGNALLISQRSIQQLDPNGKPLGSITPRFPDGKHFHHIRAVRTDAENRLWVLTTSAIHRLSPKGIVDRTLGNAPAKTGLHNVQDLKVLPDGRVFALDFESGETFVFSPTGQRLAVAKPASTDFESRPPYIPHLTVTLNGEIYLSGDDKEALIHFPPRAAASATCRFSRASPFPSPGRRKPAIAGTSPIASTGRATSSAPSTDGPMVATWSSSPSPRLPMARSSPTTRTP